MRNLFNLFYAIGCLMFIIIMSIINAIKKRHERKKYAYMNAYYPYANSGTAQSFDNNGLMMQQSFLQDQFLQQQQRDQQWAMQESIKAATPFEHGGYNMSWGNSFNEPSFFDCSSSFDSFSSFDNFGGGGMGMF